MKKGILTLGLIFVMVLTSAFTAMASRDGGRGRGDHQQRGKGRLCAMKGPGHSLARLLGQLDLTPEQEQQADRLIQANREKVQALRDQMTAVRSKLNQAMNPKTFDEKAVRQAAAEKARIQTEMMVNRAKTHQQIYALLTPEQQELADLARNLERLGGGRQKKGFRQACDFMGPRGPRNAE
ncbi:MAG: Spy/CpxP family protein refolding chaperone [Syntrophotaleaceae bacterium]